MTNLYWTELFTGSHLLISINEVSRQVYTQIYTMMVTLLAHGELVCVDKEMSVILLIIARVQVLFSFASPML